MIIRFQFLFIQKFLLGIFCDDWKIEGVILVEVFKYEVLKFVGQFLNVLKNIMLGGVVFDFC